MVPPSSLEVITPALTRREQEVTAISEKVREKATMRKSVLAFAMVLLATVLGLSSAQAQKKPACKDIPLRWFFSTTATQPDGTVVPSAIRGDGEWYADGLNNNIHVCGTSPTYDATIAVTSRRKVSFSFGAPVTGSVLSESIAGGTYSDSPFFNVRNLLCVGCRSDPSQPFTTRIGMQVKLVNQNYRLRFMPEHTDSPDRHTNPEAIPFENTPYLASPALVIPQPYDCLSGGTVKPSWIVRGTNPSADTRIAPAENLQVGTLSRVTSSSVIHAGQYSMPFEFRLEAMSCFKAY